MKIFVISLACLVGLAVAGVLDSDRMIGRMSWEDNSVEGTDRILRMSKDDLLRQKLLLDLLQHVEQPLLNEELLALSDTLVMDTNMYIGGIDDLMLNMLELCRNQRMLTKDDIFSITDDQMVRQMIGLYRILVRSRDWDTLKRNACFARKNINGVLFVNALLLAIRDRDDCQMMIMPAINEVLPQMYYDESLMRKARSIDMNLLTTDTETIRPNWLDMIGLGRRMGRMNADSVNRVAMLDKSQLWMPWREMRMELAMRKLPGQQANVMMRKENKIVLPVKRDSMEEMRLSLLTDDVGLRTFVHGLMNDLCLKDDMRMNNAPMLNEGGRMGRVSLERNMGSMIDTDMNERLWQSDMRNMGIRDGRKVLNRMDMNERDMDLMEKMNRMDDRSDIDRMHQMNGMERMDNMDRMLTMNQMSNTDRMRSMERMDHSSEINRMHQINGMGRMDRMDNVDNMDRMRSMDRNDNITPMNRWNDMGRMNHITDMDNMDRMNTVNRMDGIKSMGLDLQGRMRDEERMRQTQHMDRDTDMDMNMGMNRMLGINNLPTTDINSERLLHVNRRRLNGEQTQGGMGLDVMNSQQNRFMNIVRARGLIRDGRTVIDHQRDRNMDMNRADMHMMNRQHDIDMDMDMDLQQERIRMDEREMGIRRANINNDRLLHINRQHLQEVDEDRTMDMGMMRQQPTGRDRFMNVVNVRDGRRISGRMEDDNNMQMDMEMGTRRSSINNDRLWEMQNRRRMDEMVERDDDELLRGVDRRMGMGMIRRGMLDTDDMDMEDHRDRIRNERMRERIQEIRNEMDNDDSTRRGMNMNRGQSRLLVAGRRNRVNANDDMDSNMNMDMMNSRRRLPRSLDMMNTMSMMNVDRQERRGELLLHNLQQLMARINMDRISLGLNDIQDMQADIGSLRMNNPRLLGAADERLALRLNEMRLDTRRNRLMLEKINEIEQRLNMVIQQELRRITGQQDMKDVDMLLGDVLLGRIGGNVDILSILREMIMMTNENMTSMKPMTPMDLLLDDPIIQHLLRRMIKVIDLQRQQMGSYSREDILLRGVTINDIVVDRLRTYVDEDDSDLFNILDPQLLLAKERMQKMLVARQMRLNHKSFTINIDITADQSQRVIMRTFLMPMQDARGQQMDIDEQRLNALMLDTTIVDLIAGHNKIKRKSKEIMWTARDTTPYTEIYQRVMMAINGDLSMKSDRIIGQNCAFPHRLLLPRGRMDGLPMQMLVVITPLEGTVLSMRDNLHNDLMCGMGIDILSMDKMSLGFPLDRKITNMQQMLTVPNMMMKDVMIYHDDKIRSDII